MSGTAHTFKSWLKDALTSGVAAVTTFAAGLQQDGTAVKATLTTSLEQRACDEVFLTDLPLHHADLYHRDVNSEAVRT